MDFNFVTNLNYCAEIVNEFKTLLLYSHIIPAVFVTIFTLIILKQSKGSLLSVILAVISFSFVIWCILDIAIWLNYNSASILMFVWAPIELFAVTMFGGVYYFTRVFLYKKDISPTHKIFIFAPVVLVALLMFTKLNLEYFDLNECIAGEGVIFQNIVRSIKIIFSVATLFSIINYIRKNIADRAKFTVGLILLIGVSFFMYSSIVSGIISEITENYRLEMYGLFGMVGFISVLAYLAIKYHSFNVKIFASQILVIVIALLVLAEYLFITNFISAVLVTVTFVFVAVLGLIFVRSTIKDIKNQQHIESLVKARSEFLFVASHQLRTPVSLITGTLSLLKEGDLDTLPKEEREKMIDGVFVKAKKLTNIVNDILEASHMDIVDFSIPQETVAQLELRSLVRGVCQTLEQKANERKVVLDYSTIGYGSALPPETILEMRRVGSSKMISRALGNALIQQQGEQYDDQDPIIIRGNAHYLEQALTNVIDNAIKYSPTTTEHVGTVRVDIQNTSRRAIIMIKDNGIGISLEDQKKLFEKFARAENAMRADTEGSGLGLFIVKKIIEAHKGGSITITSDGVGRGSLTRIELDVVNE